MTIQSELEALRDSDPQHILHPERVIEWAHDNPDSALHKGLEWDDARAGHQYRLWQVRQLVKVHVRDARREPTMISLKIDRIAGGGYRQLTDVMAAPDLRCMAFAEALTELRRVQKKYHYLRELEHVWEAIAAAEAASLPDAAE
jgi:hypothetical protein